MNNEEILKIMTELLGAYQWKRPENITDEQHAEAAMALSRALALLKQTEPKRSRGPRTLFMEYINNLYKVEQELAQANYCNACHELKDFLLFDEPFFEKRILNNVIDTLTKHEREWTEWLKNADNTNEQTTRRSL